MKKLKLLSFIWGLFVVIIYPDIRYLFSAIEYALLMNGDRIGFNIGGLILIKGMHNIVILFVIFTVIILSLLYLCSRKCIDRNNNLKKHTIFGIFCCGIGMVIAELLLRVAIEISKLIKDPFFPWTTKFRFTPFFDFRFKNIISDIIMILISLFILVLCIFIRFRRSQKSDIKKI